MSLSQNQTSDLIRTYEDVETYLMDKISSRLEKGIDSPNWATRKMEEIRVLKNELESGLRSGLKGTSAKIESAVAEASIEGQDRAISEMKQIEGITTGFGKADPRKALVLSDALALRLRGMNVQIVRQGMDVYTEIIGTSSQLVELGAATRRQATQQALNKFADKGITGMIDKAGKKWTITSYAEMATRTTTTRAAVEGHLGKLQDNGYKLVIVSSHGDCCPLCAPFEGAILSISGSSDKHESLDSAIGAGLFHPNCGHSVSAYIEGLSKPVKVKYRPNDYSAQQVQRKMERDIRKWKKRKAVAINPEETIKAGQKIRDKQKNLRTFVNDNGLVRLRYREQIKKAI